MALTAKPISTISYNTEGHLKRVLNSLFDSKRIEDYRYIFHYGEDGDKDHFHVYIVPNRRIDTAVLKDMFNEQDPNNDKPLGVLPFHHSKGDHWIMYVVHDPIYLIAHKSQDDGDGKIEYQLDDIKTPYEEQLKRDYKVALRLRNTDNQLIYDEISKGKALTQIAYENDINPTKIQSMMNLYKMDTQMTEVNQILKERVQVLDEELAMKQKNLETLTKEMRLRELEYKTGLNLHNEGEKESVFDEEIKK